MGNISRRQLIKSAAAAGAASVLTAPVPAFAEGGSSSEATEDYSYYKSAYGEFSDENVEKLISDAYAHAVREQEEGSVLLRNEGAALPLQAEERSVTLFGRASADPLYKPSSGGASATGEFLVTYRAALEAAGFSVNDALFSAYESSSTVRVKAATSSTALNSADNNDTSSIGEEPIDFYTDELKASWRDSYHDVALVMFAREGGEDTDLSVSDGEGVSQLALHQSEADLLSMIRSEGVFGKVVVLLNSPWPMECGWLEDYGVDACLWIGNPSLRGFEGVANLLTGAANPSGKLTMTYAANSLSAPAMTYANANARTWENLDEVLEGCEDDDNNVSYYTIYAEGIYVGYKYYETRYEDLILGRGNADSSAGSSTGSAWNYADEMCFPFGYGLSYTTFSQTLDSVELVDGAYVAKVSVVNTGDVAGKSVVELYAQKPYGDYERQNLVEQSAVQLAGYAKTGTLEPGASETVSVSVDPYLLASYDYTAAKTYILSQGTFYLAIGDDAHDALNNILAAKGASGMYDQNGLAVAGDASKTFSWNQDALDSTTYATSRVTGEKVTNLFDAADINNLIADAVTYLSRSDWEATYPSEAVSLVATEEMIEQINGYTYEIPEGAPAVSDFVQGEDAGLKFIDMKDVPYDDDAWDDFINQLSVDDLCSLVTTSFDGSGMVGTVELPALYEGDGIDGIGSSYKYGDKRAATAYPGTLVLASSFNQELFAERGQLMGEEALYCEWVTNWGGGGDNCRTPFSGRNFEYWSEDGYVTYLGCATELAEMQKKGVCAGIKHFAGNDQEYHRESLSTFFNEQAFRENNLRAFESSFCDAGILDTMQGYSRIGCTYMAQSKELMTDLLRGEWGYEGKVITDAVIGRKYKTHYLESMAAGTDYYCWDAMTFMEAHATTAKDTIKEQIESNGDGFMLSQIRQANKHIYYALSRSMAVNGLGPNARVVAVTPAWRSALQTVTGGLGVAALLFTGLYVKREIVDNK